MCTVTVGNFDFWLKRIITNSHRQTLNNGATSEVQGTYHSFLIMPTNLIIFAINFVFVAILIVVYIPVL